MLSNAVPRVGTLGWYALPRWGKLNDGVSVPHRGIAFQRVGAVPWDPIDHHVSDPMPRWGKWHESSNGRHPFFLVLSSPMVPRMPLEWVFVMAGAQKNGPEHMCSGPRSSNNNF
jgi:hypothetical protein